MGSSSTTFLSGFVSFQEIDDIQEAGTLKGKLVVVPYCADQSEASKTFNLEVVCLHLYHIYTCVSLIQEMY